MVYLDRFRGPNLRNISGQCMRVVLLSFTCAQLKAEASSIGFPCRQETCPMRPNKNVLNAVSQSLLQHMQQAKDRTRRLADEGYYHRTLQNTYNIKV